MVGAFSDCYDGGKTTMAIRRPRKLVVNKNGQITLSKNLRTTLNIVENDVLVEVLIGKCILLLPQDLMTVREAREAIIRAEIIQESDLKFQTERKQ